MKIGKAAGPTGVTSELLKAAGVREVTNIMKERSGKDGVPEDWKSTTFIPVYKGMGGDMEC